MKSKSVFASKLLTLFLLSSGAAWAEGSIININAKVNEPVSVVLDDNPTTGYNWMIKSLADNIIFMGSEYSKDDKCKQGMTGCGGKRTLTFLPLKNGTYTVELIHGQSFDNKSWTDSQLKIVVK